MLPRDADLNIDTYRYEIARRDRRIFEMVVSILIIVVTAGIATFGAHRLLSAYAFTSFFLVFADVLRRGARRIGESTSIVEADELMQASPFCALISLIVVWIATSELLVGTGALSEPFGLLVSRVMSVLLIAGAIMATWLTAPAASDGTALVIWLSMLIPTESASPRTAPALVTLLRVVFALLVHFVLMSRIEGRIAPGRWDPMGTNAGATVIKTGATISSRKLAQTGWILQANSMLVIIGVSIGIVILNELASTRHRPTRQNTSPPSSRSSSPRTLPSRQPAIREHSRNRQPEQRRRSGNKPPQPQPPELPLNSTISTIVQSSDKEEIAEVGDIFIDPSYFNNVDG